MMGTLDTSGLQQALATAEAAGTVREAAAALRTQFAPLRVVVVDALDMRAERPIAQGERRWLYLAASDGHCWTLTTDATKAAGLFIAEQG